MEAATKTVQQLTQRILPEKPHHLSYSPDWRYHIPANESRQKHPEEWENTRLQYSTLVSEADRGVLLTRSYYDMRVEPPKPVPRDVGLLAKGGEKKKLSLSDYKNKKTSGVASDTTTPEPPSAKKRDLERAPADPKSISDMRKPDSHRQRDSHPAVDPKPQKHRENIVDMRLPPKPPVASLPPRPVSPDSRKRATNIDDDHRLQKRHRPDLPRAADDRPRPSRDEPPRRKERDSLAPPDHPPRDSKPTSSSSLPNGRSILKSSTTSATARNPSPAGRARGDSVNGVRPSVSGSTKNTPTKLDTTARTSVPPLLSPLHLSWDSQNAADKGEKKKAREDAVDGTRPTKPKKPEPPPPPKAKGDTYRDKSPVRIPALLSPTLPSALEAELSRRKVSTKTSETKVREERDKDEQPEKRNEERPKSTTARKAPVEPEEEDSGSKESSKERKRLIVNLRISKRMRQSVKRILALPPKRERSVSTEAPSAGQAKKRPATSETMGDTIAVKRPRMSSVSSLPPPPSTPSKKGTTAMSRVSSTNSQAHTPGEVTTATPVPPGSSDRPTTNGTDAPRSDKADPRAVFEKHVHFSTLGRRLKHDGDVANQRCNKLAAGGDTRGSDSNRKQYYALALESTIAFMTSFHLLNVSRNLQNKSSEPSGWASLIKMIDYLQKEARRDSRRYPPIYALVLILQAVAADEFIKSFSDFERISKEEIFQHQAIRFRNWPTVREMYESIDSSNLRADVTPWSTVDEVCQASMRVVRQWCVDENVDWTPQFNHREASIRVAR
ncbi:hypothetical protein FDECE_17370 [Fusarium decemcellulare]|nr:hypothetical protein FDECE_17370 [Fusarium decemcellulare]